MAIINRAKHEINAKIVYYGTAGSGKSTSMRYLYNRLKPSLRGEFKTVSTFGNLLQFFDFSPFETPLFGGYRVRFHIYTISGEVSNPAAWKMTLKGADGVVLTANDAPQQLGVELDSLARLRDFVGGYGLSLSDIPLLLQVNRTDEGYGCEELRTLLSLGMVQYSSTQISRGEGVLESLAKLSPLIMTKISADPLLLGKAELDSPPTEPKIRIEESILHSSQIKSMGDNSVAVGPILDLEQKCYSAVDTQPETYNGLTSVVKMEPPQILSDNSIQIPLFVKVAGGERRLLLNVSLSEG